MRIEGDIRFPFDNVLCSVLSKHSRRFSGVRLLRSHLVANWRVTSMHGAGVEREVWGGRHYTLL